MNWDDRWMHMCTEFAQFSKDRSRKTGTVIIDPSSQNIVSTGWNGFPRGIEDDVEERHHRPAKYLWSEHAERNAFYNAARLGRRTEGCTMYIPWYPCSPCARAIIQCGIHELVVIEPDWKDAKWRDDFEVSKEMLDEVVAKGRISVRFYVNPTFQAPVMLPMTS